MAPPSTSIDSPSSGRRTRSMAAQDAAGGGKVDGVRYVTKKELEEHMSTESMWTSIDGKVYDVTEWLPRHPGGDLIRMGAGRDSTGMFESSHPSYVGKTILKKYYVADMDPADYKPYYNYNSEFYVTLRDRVFGYFKENNIRPNANSVFLTKAFVILAATVVLYYYTIIEGRWWAPWLLGYALSQIGIGIMHDGNHGSTGNSYLSGFCAWTLDLIGASSFVWKHEHNIGHHQHTNMHDDPDCTTGSPFIRLSRHSQYEWYHKYQHIYTWLVYAVISAKWLISDFEFYLKGQYETHTMYPPTKRETLIFWGNKTIAIFMWFIVPALLRGPTAALYPFLVASVVSSYCFALQFAVTHISDSCVFPDGHEGPSEERDWGKLQILTATDYATDSLIAGLHSGGLNFQIEHHLFPTVCHVHYPAIQPIVEQTCKEFNVHYNNFPTYTDAITHHYRLLRDLGDPSTAPVDYSKKSN